MIKVQNIIKRFGHLVAVADVSFEVAPGDVLGFLGPNGAGKSTTMKMLCGFITPDSGSIQISGYDMAEQPIEAKTCIGYLPEGAPSYSDMTPRDFLDFIMEIRQMDPAIRKQRFDYVVEELRIQNILEQKIDTLSKGFKRRVGLAQALIHDPQVLVMDEPTDGLDPNQKHHVRSLINSLSKEKIVIISTHILEEVTAVCSRAMIVDKGKIIANSTPAELLNQSRYNNALSVSGDKTAIDALCSATTGITSNEYDTQTERWFLFTAQDKQIEVYEGLRQQIDSGAMGLKDLRIETGRLDEVFRELTQGDLA